MGKWLHMNKAVVGYSANFSLWNLVQNLIISFFQYFFSIDKCSITKGTLISNLFKFKALHCILWTTYKGYTMVRQYHHGFFSVGLTWEWWGSCSPLPYERTSYHGTYIHKYYGSNNHGQKHPLIQYITKFHVADHSLGLSFESPICFTASIVISTGINEKDPSLSFQLTDQ